jgi:hypothetical protein
MTDHTISNQTCTKCQHCGEWTNYADDPHHKARMQAMVARSASLDEIALSTARGLMPSMAGSINELCQLQAKIQIAVREALDKVTPSPVVAVGVIEKSELDSPEYGLRLWHSIHNDWDTAQQEINETVMELQDAGVTPIPHLVAVKLAVVPDA